MREKLCKRWIAAFLVVCFLLSEIIPSSVYANELTNSEVMETETDDEIITDDTDDIIESEELISEESVGETFGEIMESKAEIDNVSETVSDIDEAETEAVEEVHEAQIITGFVELSSGDKRIDTSIASKPSLEELLSVMPETLQVYLNYSSEMTEIAVEWFCVGEDYETSSHHYFQFSPLFDEEKYVLSEDIDLLTEAPYIGVFLAAGDGVATLSVTSGDAGQNETDIFYFMIEEMDYNQAAACGVLANIYCESGFDPNEEGDNGTSYGICQWHDTSEGSGRLTDLKNFCAENGYDYTSLNGQLQFLKYELENSYSSVNKYMKNVKNTEDGAYDAGYYWCYNFEVPANTEETSVSRGNLAKDTYWPEYKSVQIVPELSSIKNVAKGVYISWKKVTDADGYYVYRRDMGSSNWSLIGTVSGGDVLSYTDTKVTSGTTYYYTIEAFFGSENLADYRATEDLNYRTGPGTSYTKVGTLSKGTVVKRVLDYSSEADGYTWYKIYYDSDYYYAVADYLEPVSEESDEQEITVSDKASAMSILYLASPKVSSATNVNGGIKVAWEKVAGAKGYYVYRKNGESGYSCIGNITDGAKVSYTDKGGDSGTTYTYTVRAYSGNTKSSYDSSAAVLCLTVPDVSDAVAVNGGVKISWKQVTGADGYYVYRKLDDGKYSCIGKTTSGSKVTYTDKTPDSGQSYTYTVRAYSGDTKSSYNKQVSIVYLSAPVLSDASAVSSGIKVTWKKVTGASGYYVYRKDDNDKWVYIAKISNGSTISYTDTDVTNNKTYVYTVRAFTGSYRSYYDTAGISCKFSAPTLVNYTTTANVNYRTGPGTSYSVAGTLSKGTTVKVVSGYSTTANGYTWYKIYLNGDYYYVCADYLKKS
ncbi:MAG: phage tail tip lysozyme [Coprococcus sp.]